MKQTTRRALTRASIVDAALRIADDSADISAVTMRRVAQALDVAPMSLYNHVRTKDELLDAMADRVLGSISLDGLGDDGTPAERIGYLANALLAALKTHPAMARLLASRTTYSAEALYGSMEQPLAYLRDAGLSREDAVRTYGALLVLAMGFVNYQFPRPWSGWRESPEMAESRRQRRLHYQALPLSRFPQTIESAEQIVALADEELFMWAVRHLANSIVA